MLSHGWHLCCQHSQEDAMLWDSRLCVTLRAGSKERWHLWGPLHPLWWLSVLILAAVLGTPVDRSFKFPSTDYQCSFQQVSTLTSSFSPNVLSFPASLFNMINFWEMSRSDTFLTLLVWRCGAMWVCDILHLSLTFQSTALEICLWKDLFRNTDELKVHLEPGIKS